jgi:hypothetical protein
MFDTLKYRLSYLRHRKDFRSVEQFCLFTGYPRSGHSLVGALMDAHPEMIISHELDVLEQIIRGHSWQSIYAMIMENSHNFAKKGRSWSGYNYEVKGAWQGKFRKLKVIGDKRGGRTSLLLTENFSLMEKLKTEIPVPVRFIHVVRNPFDNIITRVRQGNDVRKEITPEGVREHIHRHFEQAAINQRVITESGCHVLTLRHEELISNPEAVLISICNFLELEAPAQWLKACASIVFEKPRKTRHEFDYPKEMIDEIMEKMGEFPFFEGYSFFD